VRFLVSALVAALLWGAPLPAHADEEPWRAARAHYEHGVELANKGEYKAALEQFNAAYAASPHFAVLYNIGQAEVALGRPRRAIDALSKYLRDGKDDVPVPRRQQVQAQIAQLESVFASLTIATDPPGAQLTLDGIEIGRSPTDAPRRLAAGSHVVTAARPDGPLVTRVVSLAEGEQFTLTLTLPPSEPRILSMQCWELGAQPILDGEPVDVSKAGLGVPVAAGRHRVGFTSPERRWPEQFVEVPPGVRATVLCGTVPAPVHDKTPAPSAEARFPTGYVLIGTGAAVGVAALVQGLWNGSRARDWETEQASIEADPSSGRYVRQVANNELAESIDRGSAVTVALTATAGAFVAGGVVWLVLDEPAAAKQPPKQAKLLLPVSLDVGRGSAALSFRGTW
jgi:hypothetical protein